MKKCMTWLMAALCSVAVAAPAVAADTIKIGVQGAHSGDLASYGVPSLNAAKIVIEEANAKGGVLGKKIELVSQDDQCKPELATNAATKLISDKVVAIMGPICSGATNASLPMFESANIISISPTATTPAPDPGRQAPPVPAHRGQRQCPGPADQQLHHRCAEGQEGRLPA